MSDRPTSGTDTPYDQELDDFQQSVVDTPTNLGSPIAPVAVEPAAPESFDTMADGLLVDAVETGQKLRQEIERRDQAQAESALGARAIESLEDGSWIDGYGDVNPVDLVETLRLHAPSQVDAFLAEWAGVDEESATAYSNARNIEAAVAYRNHQESERAKQVSAAEAEAKAVNDEVNAVVESARSKDSWMRDNSESFERAATEIVNAGATKTILPADATAADHAQVALNYARWRAAEMEKTDVHRSLLWQEQDLRVRSNVNNLLPDRDLSIGAFVDAMEQESWQGNRDILNFDPASITKPAPTDWRKPIDRTPPKAVPKDRDHSMMGRETAASLNAAWAKPGR
jgi:hypothetical protein